MCDDGMEVIKGEDYRINWDRSVLCGSAVVLVCTVTVKYSVLSVLNYNIFVLYSNVVISPKPRWIVVQLADFLYVYVVMTRTLYVLLLEQMRRSTKDEKKKKTELFYFSVLIFFFFLWGINLTVIVKIWVWYFSRGILQKKIEEER